MNKELKALNYFRNQFNCAQAVFTVFGTEKGLSEDHSLKIACGFGAGMGRQQFVCGALTGAIMALGLAYGKKMGDPEEKKADTYARTRALFKEFISINGSSNCRELLNGLDINDPEDYKKIIAQNLFVSKCEKYVADAVRITEQIL